MFPISDFAGVIAIAPSVSLNSPAGVGIGESKNIQIRGFQDGQFNITYDAIPFGDSNDNTHHSNSYFPSTNIGEVAIDRGPGTAGTIGNATFGGTIALFSPSTSPNTYLKPYTTIASFNTELYGVQASSGPIRQLFGTNVIASVQDLTSDGALSYTPSRQENAFFKAETPIGAHTVITAVSSLVNLRYATPSGITLAQTQAFSKSFGLSNNPGSESYYDDNTQRHDTDFEYIGINSDFGSLHIDNKSYTYAYRNTGPTGSDLTGTKAVGLKGLGAADTFGTTKLNAYRGIGDTLHLAYDLPWATLRTGVWVNSTLSNRWQYNVDFTRDTAYYTVGTTNFAGLRYNYFMRYNDLTIQPFADLDLRPLPGLTITPGVKHTDIRRDLKEAVDPGTLKPYDNTLDYSATLPFITARYEVSPCASIYGQYAQGFQAPPINVVYVSNGNAGALQPQTTNNYQAGGVLRLPRWVADIDFYDIEFNNFIQSTTDPTNPTETDYANAGSVTYRGVEGEVTYAVGHGVSLFGNGSINGARYGDKNPVNAGLHVSNSPDSTAAFGTIYAYGPWRASLIGKYIGSQYRDSATKTASGIALAQGFRIGGYGTANFVTSYTFPTLWTYASHAKVEVGVDNISNDRSITDIKGGKTAPLNLYSYDVERNYFISLSAAF